MVAILESLHEKQNISGRFEAILEVICSLEMLWIDVHSHLIKINGYDRKFYALRRILLSNTYSNTNTNGDSNTNTNIDGLKLLEKEPYQVRKVLESSVIVREVLAEVKGQIMALRRLKADLSDVENSFIHNLTVKRDTILITDGDDSDDDIYLNNDDPMPHKKKKQIEVFKIGRAHV